MHTGMRLKWKIPDDNQVWNICIGIVWTVMKKYDSVPEN
jgi:hypothetical protein